MKDSWIVSKAAQMRICPTFSEARALDSFEGKIDYESQVILQRYILDFVFPSKLLVLEIDGNTHEAEQDAIRDAYCEALGLRVLRIPNKLANTAWEEISKFPDVVGAEAKWQDIQKVAPKEEYRQYTGKPRPYVRKCKTSCSPKYLKRLAQEDTVIGNALTAPKVKVVLSDTSASPF